MDKSVPAGAAILLDFIRLIEVGRTDRASYDVIYGHNQNKLPKPITSMTIGELVDAQASFTKRFGSSASGGYQFMKATLQDLVRELHLRGTQVFDPDLQDRLAYHFLKRRGFDDYMADTISRTEFGKCLAQEWASFPVLAATKGGGKDKNGKPLNLTVKCGQSFYAGDPLNKSLISPEQLEAVLDQVKQAKEPDPVASTEPVIVDADKPILKTKRFWTWFTGGGAGVVMPFVDWRVQMVLMVFVLAVTTYSILTTDQARKKLERVVNKMLDEL